MFLNKELVTLIKDILKHLKMSISFIWTWIIYMDPQWDNIWLLIILNVSKTKKIEEKLLKTKNNSSTGCVVKVYLGNP